MSLKLQNRSASSLQSRKTGVQGGALLVDLRYPAAKLANLSNKPGIVLDHMHYGALVVMTGGVEACVT